MTWHKILYNTVVSVSFFYKEQRTDQKDDVLFDDDSSAVCDTVFGSVVLVGGAGGRGSEGMVIVCHIEICL